MVRQLGPATCLLLVSTSMAIAAGLQKTVAESRAFEGETARTRIALRAAWQASGSAPETSEAGSPSITALKVLTPVINVAKQPAAPRVALSYETKSGFGAIFLRFTSQTSGLSVTLPFEPSGTSLPKSGSLVLESPANALNRYAAQGTWSLTDSAILDRAGNETDSPPSGATFQVVNRLGEDVTPPSATSGQILTPTVSLSSKYPAFQTTLQLSDDNSGAVSVLLYLLPQDVPQEPHIFNSVCPHPIVKTELCRASALLSNVPTGNWIINEVDVFDAAGNTNFYVGSSIISIFGTNSFSVTQ